MDFIELANGLDKVTSTLLRYLTTKTTTDAGDDDFARIDGEYAASSAHALEHQSYNTYDDTGGAQDAILSETSVQINRPFLSPTAEAELYLLATNFLLCKSKLSVYLDENYARVPC